LLHWYVKFSPPLLRSSPRSLILLGSAFPNARGAVEDTQGSCMMKRRLQRKFEWMELPAVLAEGLLRLHGVGAELAESVFSSGDTGTTLRSQDGHFHPIEVTDRDARWCDEAPRSVFVLIPRISGSTPPADGATSTCVLGERSATLVNKTIIFHLPARHVSTDGSEKRVLERVEPRCSRALGQSSRRMPARLP